MKTGIKFLTIIFFCFFSKDSIAQDTTKILSGKWTVCFSWDNYDSLCLKPFNAYHLEAGGNYEDLIPFVCMDKKYFATGRWTIIDRVLKINIESKECLHKYAQTYYNIVILNEDFFYSYSSTPSTMENPGHIAFYSFRRIK